MILLLLACGAPLDVAATAVTATAVASTVGDLPSLVHIDDFDPASLAPGERPPILISTPIREDGSGVACASSCAGPDAQDHDVLEAELIPHILEEWNTQPVGEPTLELETLLFYLHDTNAYIAEHGTPGLDTRHAEFLLAELARDTVTMEMRLLDEQGVVVAWVPEQDFPLWEKQHITFQGTGSLGHLETGGKAKRVGLAHLWTRW